MTPSKDFFDPFFTNCLSNRLSKRARGSFLRQAHCAIKQHHKLFRNAKCKQAQFFEFFATLHEVFSHVNFVTVCGNSKGLHHCKYFNNVVVGRLQARTKRNSHPTCCTRLCGLSVRHDNSKSVDMTKRSLQGHCTYLHFD